MTEDTLQQYFSGQFITPAATLKEKLKKIKAFVFDWDGVFNNGYKDENGVSPFSEIDAVGTNQLRLNHYLLTGNIPITAIITGEQNQASFKLAKREHFNAVFYKIRYKIKAFEYLCSQYQLQPHEVAFVFDDVLDFGVAAQCGVRLMVNRKANPLLVDYAVRNNLVDYLSNAESGGFAVREFVELVVGLSGIYDETIGHRINFSPTYQQYLAARAQATTAFYTSDSTDTILQKTPV